MSNDATSCFSVFGQEVKRVRETDWLSSTPDQLPQPVSYQPLESLVALNSAIQQFIASGGGLSSTQLALVSMYLHLDCEKRTSSGRLVPSERLIPTLLEGLRPLVRKTDQVFLLGSSLHFLLAGANLQGGQIVQSRLWDAVLWHLHHRGEGELLTGWISIGHSAYPGPCKRVEQLLESASEGQQRADFCAERGTRKASSRQTVKLPALDPKGSTGNGSGRGAEEEMQALARKLHVPFLPMLPRKASERVQQLVDRKLAQELQCYPLGRERNQLTVAMANPQDRAVLQRLEQETGFHIFPVLTHPQELELALEQLL